MSIKFDSTLPRKTTDWLGARFGEVGDAWGSVKDRFPAEANIALGVAGVFTFFNMWQGGGIMRSLGRGLVAVATVLGISVAAKAIADDDNPDRGGWDLFQRNDTPHKNTHHQDVGEPLDPFKPGTFEQSSERKTVSDNKNTVHNASIKRQRIPGEFDVLVIEGQLTEAQIATIANLDPNDNFDIGEVPRHYAGNAVGALTPNSPFTQNAQGQLIQLTDAAIDKLPTR